MKRYDEYTTLFIMISYSIHFKMALGLVLGGFHWRETHMLRLWNFFSIPSNFMKGFSKLLHSDILRGCELIKVIVKDSLRATSSPESVLLKSVLW